MVDPNEYVRRGWSKERIKAALREKGFSLASLARMHEKHRTYFSMVLIQPMRHGEKIIAEILDVDPSEIWPARYDEDGNPYQGRFLPENDAHLKSPEGQESETGDAA